MRHTALAGLVEAYEQAEEELKSRHSAIWGELAKAEPELASEILLLFLTPEAAARWITSPAMSKETPMRKIVEGRAAEVLETVQRIAHGFGA